MKVKVLVHIPPFETEVEVPDVVEDGSFKYACDVATERTADSLRDSDFWFKWNELKTEIK